MGKHTSVLPEICTECGSVDLHLKTNCGHVVSAQCQDCHYYWPLDVAYPLRMGNAAPGLLEACKLALKRFDDLYTGYPRSTASIASEPAMDSLRAAIAKAEGH